MPLMSIGSRNGVGTIVHPCCRTGSGTELVWGSSKTPGCRWTIFWGAMPGPWRGSRAILDRRLLQLGKMLYPSIAPGLHRVVGMLIR